MTNKKRANNLSVFIIIAVALAIVGIVIAESGQSLEDELAQLEQELASSND